MRKDPGGYNPEAMRIAQEEQADAEMRDRNALVQRLVQTTLRTFEISTGAANRLEKHNVQFLFEVVELDPKDITHDGKGKSVEEIQNALRHVDEEWRMGMDLDPEVRAMCEDRVRNRRILQPLRDFVGTAHRVNPTFESWGGMDTPIWQIMGRPRKELKDGLGENLYKMTQGNLWGIGLSLHSAPSDKRRARLQLLSEDITRDEYEAALAAPLSAEERLRKIRERDEFLDTPLEELWEATALLKQVHKRLLGAGIKTLRAVDGKKQEEIRRMVPGLGVNGVTVLRRIMKRYDAPDDDANRRNKF